MSPFRPPGVLPTVLAIEAQTWGPGSRGDAQGIGICSVLDGAGSLISGSPHLEVLARDCPPTAQPCFSMDIEGGHVRPGSPTDPMWALLAPGMSPWPLGLPCSALTTLFPILGTGWASKTQSDDLRPPPRLSAPHGSSSPKSGGGVTGQTGGWAWDSRLGAHLSTDPKA